MNSFIIAIHIILLKASNCDNNYVNDCQNDWFNYKNIKCIKLLTETKVNYREANNECHKLNASLVSIESEDQNLFITSLLYGLDPTVKGLYIGLNRKKQNNSYVNEFQWTDSSVTLEENGLVYSNWAPGEPSPWFEPCVEVYSMDINAGKWNDLSCNGLRFAICQQLMQNYSNEYRIGFELCEHLDYVRYRDNCYKAYDNYLALEWTEAEKKCKSDHKNASLLFIEDSYEYSFIRYWTKAYMKTIEFWIGLKTQNNSFSLQYEWINEWPVYFTAWEPEEPKVWPQVTNQCVVQNRDTGLWRNNPYCSDKRPFVCKISDHSMPGDERYVKQFCPQFVNSSNPNIQSTDNWINLHKHSKHCHWFSDTLTSNWSSASKHCRQRNGTLVSIHSRHELELLKPFVLKYESQLWIGLYQSPSGRYRWEDGSDLDYQNWFPGEPTDDRNELCVEMRAQDMTWNDVKCDGHELGFICETNKLINQSIDINTDYKHLNPRKVVIKTDSNSKIDGQINGQSSHISVGIICLIIIIILLIGALSVSSYFWSNSFGQCFTGYCFCLNILNRRHNTTTTLSNINSNRSSVNETNLFDVR